VLNVKKKLHALLLNDLPVVNFARMCLLIADFYLTVYVDKPALEPAGDFPGRGAFSA
jgi:hypothetical protein